MESYSVIPGPPGASERHLSYQSGTTSAVCPVLLSFLARPVACGRFLAWSEAAVPRRSAGLLPEWDRKVRQEFIKNDIRLSQNKVGEIKKKNLF